MSTIKFINPDGAEVEVPESDAPHFDAKGWPRAEGYGKQQEEGKPYAKMTVPELKALLAERGIEAEGNKADLIAALELADEENEQ